MKDNKEEPEEFFEIFEDQLWDDKEAIIIDITDRMV